MLFPAPIQELDEVLLRAAQTTPGWAISVLWVLTTIGGGWGLLLTVPWLFRKSSRMAVVWLLGTELVVSGVGQTIKRFVERVRPCDALGWCPPLIGFSPGGYSFPSGHAAGSFCFCAFVSVMRPRLAPVLMPLAGLIAWSRCVLGLHYPSDVAGGAILGSCFGVAAALVARRLHGPPPIAAAPSLAQPANAEEPPPRTSERGEERSSRERLQ